VMTIEIGGLVRGSGYDWIQVSGTANLNGTLNVNNFGSFVAPAGSSFTFLNAGATSGSFSSTNLPVVPGFVLTSLAGALTLSVPAPSIPPGAVLVIDPISVANDRLIANDDLLAALSVVAPLADTEDTREIEVEGCR